VVERMSAVAFLRLSERGCAALFRPKEEAQETARGIVTKLFWLSPTSSSRRQKGAHQSRLRPALTWLANRSIQAA